MRGDHERRELSADLFDTILRSVFADRGFDADGLKLIHAQRHKFAAIACDFAESLIEECEARETARLNELILRTLEKYGSMELPTLDFVLSDVIESRQLSDGLNRLLSQGRVVKDESSPPVFRVAGEPQA